MNQLDKSRKYALDLDRKHIAILKGNDEVKKVKSIKKCVIKRKIKFDDYKKCLEASQIENKPFRKK